ncbi:MAG: hypothetical protein PVF66_06820, partial [Candidatus Aminicenantes bacterium]
GIDRIGRWKTNIKGDKQFPRDIEFVPGMGVFMEEFKTSLAGMGVDPDWIGIPGKSIRSLKPESFEKTLKKLDKI